MSDDRENARKQYSKTRSEFEKLGGQDKTAFVIEATFATIGEAIDETGRHLADALEYVANFDFVVWDRPEPDEPDTPNPAEPPSAKKRASSRPRPKKEDEE